MKYLVSNLKANFNKNNMEIYIEAIRRIPKEGFKFIVCPSAIYMNKFNVDNCILGAQDVSVFKTGAYTGEITAKQYASVGCKYAIIGHYERRKYFHEDYNIISKKVRNALDSGMEVIYCIGESEQDLIKNDVLHSIEQQIACVLNDFTHEEIKNIIIAYEPKWAIGTNKIPEMNAIKSTIKFIKKIIKDYYELDLDVIYGGSINRANIILLRNIKEIDGFMVGASSLNIEELNRIINLTIIDNN